jgi:tetratricopeptide (TPR) repeat protein
MQMFSVKDVERVLKIPRSAISTLIRGGFVSPARGRRRQYEFSFQDLVALRTARALMLARVSPRGISQALRQLRQSVTREPLSGNLRICASGTELVVRDESGPWRTPSGQFLLELDVRVQGGNLEILERSTATILETEPADQRAEAVDEEALFQRALESEESSAEDAIRSYRRCLEANPQNVAARVNCGRLLHAAENLADAESLYREGLKAGCEDSNLLFNLALVLEDTGRELEAVDLYKRALSLEPDFADAHFNLARLYQHLKMSRAAIRHWNQYRRLTPKPD